MTDYKKLINIIDNEITKSNAESVKDNYHAEYWDGYFDAMTYLRAFVESAAIDWSDEE